ncbi:MAG: hypothetical protein RMJ67_05405 [Elusimicrobiota bacterium]|nr:hypothetical protein [Endomicrobiia bacterium]MDW8165926.1 hypothetical protein [Elusimicrobiota bacterium]
MKIIIFVLLVLFSFSFISSKEFKNDIQKFLQTKMPDVSVVGSLYSEFSKDADKILNIKDIEVAFQGYIYPQLYSNVVFAFHNEEFNLEEAYLSFSGLYGFDFSFGRKFLSVGKVNKIHSHHLSYLEKPKFIKMFFAPDGLLGDGIEVGYLFPLEFFTKINLGVYDLSEKPHLHNHLSNEDSDFYLTGRSFFSKIWFSFPIRLTELELGLNYILSNGPYYLSHKDEISIYGLDLTLRYLISTYKKIKFQTEIFSVVRQHHHGLDDTDHQVNKLGGYFFVEYKISSLWKIGLKYDFVEQILNGNYRCIDFIITRNLTEESYLRSQYRYEISYNNHIGFLQVVFGLGPHSHMLE